MDSQLTSHPPSRVPSYWISECSCRNNTKLWEAAPVLCPPPPGKKRNKNKILGIDHAARKKKKLSIFFSSSYQSQLLVPKCALKDSSTYCVQIQSFTLQLHVWELESIMLRCVLALLFVRLLSKYTIFI